MPCTAVSYCYPIRLIGMRSFLSFAKCVVYINWYVLRCCVNMFSSRVSCCACPREAIYQPRPSYDTRHGSLPGMETQHVFAGDMLAYTPPALGIGMGTWLPGLAWEHAHCQDPAKKRHIYMPSGIERISDLLSQGLQFMLILNV